MAILIEAYQISKSFADQKLFSFEMFKVFSGDKIGIIGANGSGKTTLLNILSGQMEADEGHVRRFCEISYFKQFGNIEQKSDPIRLSKYSVKDKLDADKMSGGERTRLKIAGTFGNGHELILADEITTNLDINGIELVTRDLQLAESVLLISHDRRLLDTVCNRIIAIENGELQFYHGNYSTYLEQRKLKREFAAFEYNQYIDEKIRLENSIKQIKQKASKMKSAPKRMGNSEARIHKGDVKARQKKVQRSSRAMKSRLEALEVKHNVKEKNIYLDFSLTTPPHNKFVIQANDILFSYPNQTMLYENSSFHIPNGSKTCLYGPNGCGKTTLMNQIEQKALGIYVVPKAKLGIFHQNLENLDYQKTVLENAVMNSVQSVTVVRTLLARLLFRRDDCEKLVKNLSGGERVKLSLCKLFVSDANVLLLDEPTNFLDIPTIEELQKMLIEYKGTLIFVSHDQSLISAVADRLILFEDHHLITYENGLTDYIEYSKSKK